MGITLKRLGDNLKALRENIAAAAARSRRDPTSVLLVAVTKTADPEDIRNLIELGVVELGESRVQQLTVRAEEVRQWLARRRKDTPPVRWHMLGHLQRNKVRPALEAAAMIQSVDTLRLAEEINLRAEQAGRTVEVLLEVNCSGEPQKFGVSMAAAAALTEQVCTLRNLRLLGLMTMAPFVSNPENARPTFIRLRELFEEMRNEKIGGKDFLHLSMGMTQDYPVAVEEGATIIRVGTALFR
jgi:hypothetical protein